MTRPEMEFGTSVPARAPIKFVQPDTTFDLFVFTAFIAVSTTSSTVCCPFTWIGRSMFDATKKFVFVEPGQRAKILIPYGRFSSAIASENDDTKAFVAAYVAMNGIGWKPAADETLMIVPLRRARISCRK